MKKLFDFSFVKIIFVSLLLISFASPSVALAATSGPNNAGTGTNMNGPGTVAWTNTNNITADDTSYATANLGTNATSEYLQSTNYSFVVPSDAVINGIQVSIMRQSSANTGGASVNDVDLNLLKAGVIVGTDKASLSDWPTSMGLATYGGTADLWGTTWTPSDINALNFGVSLSVLNQSGFSSRTASVDYMQITVTYTLPDTIAPTVVSINKTAADPTGAANVSWTVTFSEPVTGVDTADFALVNTGLEGTLAIINITGTGATRTVVASVGTGAGTLGLNLTDDDTILDLAATPNQLGGTGLGNGNFTGEVYTIDRVAPMLAVVTPIPTPSSNTTPSFTFSSTKAGNITFGGSCGSAAPAVAIAGNTTVTYGALSQNTYSNCTVKVIDSLGNQSNMLSIPSFIIDTSIFPQGMVSLNFDDGLISAYNNMALLGGYKSTQYIYTGATYGATYGGWTGYMNEIQVKNLRDAGHDIGAHSRTHMGVLTSTTTDALKYEIDGSRLDLLNLGIIPVNSFAYPFGDNDTVAQNAARAAGLVGARGVEDGFNTLSTNRYNLLIQQVNGDTTVSQVTGWIDQALAGKSWLILLFHEVKPACAETEGNSTEEVPYYCVKDTDLSSIISYLNSQGASVVTIKEGLALITGNSSNDSTIPAIAQPVNMTVEATSAVGANVAYTLPTVTDNLDIGLTPLCTPFSGSAFSMGTTTVTCTAADTSGNRALAKTFDVGVINSIIPSLILTTTASSSTNISPIPITATFSESVTGLAVGDIVVTNGNAVNFSGGGAVYTFDITPLADGEVVVNIPAGSAQDIAEVGNTATTALSVMYDSTAPTAEITNGPADTSTITTNEATFEFTTTGATTVECKLDAGVFGVCVSPTILSTLSEGAHTFTVKVSDEALNLAEASRTFTVDTLPPTLAEVTPVPNPVNTTPSYTFSSNEAGSIIYGGDCSSATVSAAVGNNTIAFNALAGGEHGNCTVTVTDAFAHASVPLAVNIFTVDAEAPVIMLDVLPGNVINAANLATAVIDYSVTGNVGDALCAFDSETPAICTASPISLSGLIEGAHLFAISAKDEVNNKATSTVSFSVDFTAPTLTVNTLATNDTTPTITGTSNEVADISILVRNGDESFNQTYPTISSNIAWAVEVPDTLPDGIYDIFVRGTDAAGNESSEAQGVLTVNTEIPNLTVDAPANNSTTITGTTDADATVTVAIGGFGPYEATGEETGIWSAIITDTLAEAIHPVQAIAVDPLGNSATDNTSMLTIDITGSVLTLNGSNPVDVNVNGIYEEPGATGIDNIDSVVSVIISGDLVDTLVLNAVYTIKYNALDSSGNAASEITRTVNIKDLEAPVITLLGDSPMSLAVGQVYSEPGATVADNVDNSLVATIGGDSIDTSVIGTYEVTYDVTDTTGNAATQVVRTVVISDLVVSTEQTAAPTTDSTTITWISSHPSTSRVIYDTASHNPIIEPAPNYGYANSTVEDANLVTEHSVTVSGLSSGTTYYFRPVSHGSPEVVGDEISVTTATPPPAPSPSRSGGGGRRVAIATTTTPAAIGQVLGASTEFQFTRTLVVGMTGEDVSELQRRLTSEGVYSGPITGYFGPLTEAGVRAYQAKYGIDQVGIVGPKTRAKLNEGSAVLGAQTVGGDMTIEQMKALLNQLQAQLNELLAKQKALLSVNN